MKPRMTPVWTCFGVLLFLSSAAHAATPPALPTTDPVTVSAIDAALVGAQRSEANKARDVYRHPKETLSFFGLRGDMTVVEIWPGAGGWYTEILAPVLREKGMYYAAHADPDGQGVKKYREKLASDPATYDRVNVSTLWPGQTDIAPPGSADMVVTFRNIHNWMARDFAPEAFAAMFRALKPGGILGVEEHRGNPAVVQDPKAKSGYVNEEYAIKMIEAAGFKLVGKSPINANPKDTKDYEKGVWTLPPTYTRGDEDRGKYAAIGESDRFTLRFVKPVK